MGMQEFNSRFYKNQSAPRGVLETEGVLSDEGAKRLKTSWEEIHGGPHNAHRVAVLEQGLKFNPIQMNNVDSQFLESRKFQKQEICSIFRVPPHKAADLERSTHSNIEQQNMEFATDALMPWIKRFEEQILIGCLSNRDRLLGYAPEFDLKAMMRADSAARSTYYRQMFAIGCISQNEVREDENMNPIDLGDRYFVPLNMVPTDKLDEFLAQDAPKVGGTPSELGEQGTPDGSAGGQDGSK
jgi:HK97 family phage portal protein